MENDGNHKPPGIKQWSRSSKSGRISPVVWRCGVEESWLWKGVTVAQWLWLDWEISVKGGGRKLRSQIWDVFSKEIYESDMLGNIRNWHAWTCLRNRVLSIPKQENDPSPKSWWINQWMKEQLQQIRASPIKNNPINRPQWNIPLAVSIAFLTGQAL